MMERHLQTSGQQSPKIHMQVSGMKAAVIDDASEEDDFFSTAKTDESQAAVVAEAKSDQGQVEEGRAEGQDPNVA